MGEVVVERDSMTGSSNAGEHRQTDRQKEQLGKNLTPPSRLDQFHITEAHFDQQNHHASQQAAVSSAADGLSLSVGGWVGGEVFNLSGFTLLLITRLHRDGQSAVVDVTSAAP